jgi:hypothetical protein
MQLLVISTTSVWSTLAEDNTVHDFTALGPNWVAVILLSRENREIEARHAIGWTLWCRLFFSVMVNCALYIMPDENIQLTNLEFVLNSGKCMNPASDKFTTTVCNQHSTRQVALTSHFLNTNEVWKPKIIIVWEKNCHHVWEVILR